MDKETLSNYGWIVICVLVIAIMVALATPFGSYIQTGIENTTQGLFDTSRNAVNSTGLTRLARQRFHPSAFTVEFEKLHQGEEKEDRFIYGDYEYSYNQYYRPDTGEWVDYEIMDGFSIRPLDASKTEYGEILETAYGYPVTGLVYTFYNCIQLTTAPKIPYYTKYLSGAFQGCTALTKAPDMSDADDVTNMYAMFWGCTSLSDLSSFRIPSGVTNVQYMFGYCSSLTDASSLVIPSGADDMLQMFIYCTSLTKAPNMSIATGVTSMKYAFYECSSLTDLSGMSIPSSVTSLDSTFYNCTLLVSPPNISNIKNIDALNATFANCSSLLIAPTLPNNVKSLSSLFYGCKSLKAYEENPSANGDFSGYIIPSGVENMHTTFYECDSIILPPSLPSTVTNLMATFMNMDELTTAPDIPNGVIDMTGTFNGDKKLVSAPTIPSSVTSLNQTFTSCYSLTGSIEINANPSNYFNCLKYTQITEVTGTTTLKSQILATK